MYAFLADCLGILGSVVLAVPAIRFSHYLRQVDQIKQMARRNSATGNQNDDLRETLLNVMMSHTTTWNRTDHQLLIVGFVLLAFSFVVSLLSHSL